MKIEDLKNKLVAVLGFGQEGKAVTGYLLKHGVIPVLFDERLWQGLSDEEKQHIKSLKLNFIFGPGYLEELKGFDVVFRSPGVKLSDLKASQSANNKIITTSQTKWFFEHCPCRIIGVTGTKGKGTTASLICEILKKQFPKIYLTGNIGKEQPMDFLDELQSDDWVVYELSSFQLQDLDKSPHIGVVLMVTQEHLDYHRDVNEYVQAKEAIVKFQKPDDYAIINIDYPSSGKIGQLGQGIKKIFSAKGLEQADCYAQEGVIYAKFQGSSANGGAAEPIINTADLQLKGRHNWENVCAAVLASVAAGCEAQAIQQAAVNFKGLEHRLEFVAEKGGNKFYNDSFSTTPETAIAAIKAFSEPLILILGGSSKNSDFADLAKTINTTQNIQALILIGQEAPRIKKALESAGGFKGNVLEGADSMEAIFKQVKRLSKEGDVVLLSPACASFGMFKNYKDRGEQFKNYVHNF